MKNFSVTKLIPLYNRQEEWEYRIRMINEAKKFFYTSTYFLHNDYYGIKYTDALLAAHKRGVDITLLIDSFGQALASHLMKNEEIKLFKKTLQLFKKNHIKIIFYKCRFPLQKLLGSGMHIKIQISDGGGAIFSSGNISATSYDKWNEFAVYVEGKITTVLLEEFSKMGIYVDNNHKQFLSNLNLSETQTQSLGYISYNPTIDRHWLNPIKLKNPNSITDYLHDIFTQATERISLTSLYFKPVSLLVKDLIDAAKRGVKVEIFHSHREALGVSITPWLPSIYLYQSLLDAGITIYENTKGEHSKIILIDNKTALFGSYNLEYAAHDRLAEAMMMTTQPKILTTIDTIFTELRASKDNIKINAHSHSDFSLSTRLKILLAKPFCRWI